MQSACGIKHISKYFLFSNFLLFMNFCETPVMACCNLILFICEYFISVEYGLEI